MQHILVFNFYGALFGFVFFLLLLIYSNSILRLLGLGRPGEGRRGRIDKEAASSVDTGSDDYLDLMGWRKRVKFFLWLFTIVFGVGLFLKVAFMVGVPGGHGQQTVGDQEDIAQPELIEAPTLRSIDRPTWEEQKSKFRDGTF